MPLESDADVPVVEKGFAHRGKLRTIPGMSTKLPVDIDLAQGRACKATALNF